MKGETFKEKNDDQLKALKEKYNQECARVEVCENEQNKTSPSRPRDIYEVFHNINLSKLLPTIMSLHFELSIPK